MNNSGKVMMVGPGFKSAMIAALLGGLGVVKQTMSCPFGIEVKRDDMYPRLGSYLTKPSANPRKPYQRKRHRTVKAETTYGRNVRMALNDQAMTRNQKKKFYAGKPY